MNQDLLKEIQNLKERLNEMKFAARKVGETPKIYLQELQKMIEKDNREFGYQVREFEGLVEELGLSIDNSLKTMEKGIQETQTKIKAMEQKIQELQKQIQELSKK